MGSTFQQRLFVLASAAGAAFGGLAVADAGAADATRETTQVIIVEGTGTGPIPDGPGGTGPGCGPVGPSLDVSFLVPPFVGTVVDVEVMVEFDPHHTWGGDVIATLIDPKGTEHTLFGRIRSIFESSCGDRSDLAGPYFFTDAAKPPFGGFWQAAEAALGKEPIAAGDYWTTATGGVGAVDPAPPTSLRESFAGQVGTPDSTTWVLRVVDTGPNDTGSVSAATLVLTVDEPIFRNGFEQD